MRSMTAYYNENDKHAAAWLRELIRHGLITDGVVDERSIEDVKPEDVRGFTQCHFFAGIGGWSHAFRLANWSDKRPVWSGSCPCQPFSEAGAGNGFADQRHLWPHWFHLIKECRPAIVFGEQVASRSAEPWLDLVSDDMEAMGYAIGAVAFPSASVGAPHIRDRTYWVADSSRTGLERGVFRRKDKKWEMEYRHAGCDGTTGGMADTNGDRCEARSERPSPLGYGAAIESDSSISELAITPSHPTDGFWRKADWLFCRDGKWRPVKSGIEPLADGVSARMVRLRGYGNAINPHQAAIFIKAAMK